MLLGAALMTTGCSHDEKSAGSSTAAAKQKADKGGGATEASRTDSVVSQAETADIPTEEEKEEAVEKTITSSNVDDEVSKLEKELGK